MELLERQAQLEELTRHLREAGSGAGKIAFVSGEAGVGKSALLEQFALRAVRTARVLWGHCDALQTSRVLGPVHELIASLAALSETRQEPSLAREQLFLRLFQRFSPPNPLSIVILEDVHWADEATLDFVRFLGRRIQRTRCLLIATYRDDELTPTHLLRSVLGELTGQHTARIHLPALSLNAIEQLARGTARDARKVYEVTGGNPFFVRELLATAGDTVPETVRDAVLARLLQCSPAARDVAELVSLLPGRTESWLVRSILGEMGPGADESVARGLLRYYGDMLGFRHELGRLAVESAIPGGRAQSLHQSILKSLVEQHADLSRLVHHASHAQDVKSLLEYAPKAAEQAARAGAHRQAVAHLATALRHIASLSAPERARLFELHASECNVTNQVAPALDSARKALALWRELEDVTAQARVLLLIGRLQWKEGQTALSERYVREATTLLESFAPGHELAMAYSARSQLAMLGRRVEETLEFGQRALELVGPAGDSRVRAHALNNMGTVLLCSGGDGGLAKLEQSLAIALEHDLQEHAARAYTNLVSCLVRLRALDPAERYLREGIDYCDLHEVQDCLYYIQAYGACLALNRGDWDEAARTATEGLKYHDALTVQERMNSLVVLALVRARRGDPGAEPLLDEATRLAVPTGELQRIGPVAAARAELAWYRGDLQAVRTEVAVGLSAAAGHRDRWIVGELAYWGRLADPTLEVPADLAEPFALMIEGDWESAAAAWKKHGTPYERALALADGPEAALRESLEIVERLGGGPLAAIVRQRLRDLGVRGIPRGPRSSTRENPAGLTTREVQVLMLLVKGHTNGEIALRLHVSAKTIEHHVSAILGKLEVESRTEAVAAAFALGIASAPSMHSA